jgi:hypothetical protein
MSAPASKVVVGGADGKIFVGGSWIAASSGGAFLDSLNIEVSTVGGGMYEDAVKTLSGVVRGGLPGRGGGKPCTDAPAAQLARTTPLATTLPPTGTTRPPATRVTEAATTHMTRPHITAEFTTPVTTPTQHAAATVLSKPTTGGQESFSHENSRNVRQCRPRQYLRHQKLK